eukprot:129550-Pyramimonas_sp.AAC.1
MMYYEKYGLRKELYEGSGGNLVDGVPPVQVHVCLRACRHAWKQRFDRCVPALLKKIHLPTVSSLFGFWRLPSFLFPRFSLLFRFWTLPSNS